MRKVTLVFLIKEDKILLAMKKRGFGMNLYNGIGGKQDEGETILDTAKRETFEEIGVKVDNLEQVAILNFYTNNKTSEHQFDQQAYVYLVRSWKNEPIETDEMSPKWFNVQEIPFNQMWEDDPFWLPRILAGEKLEADFIFDEQGHLLSHEIKPL